MVSYPQEVKQNSAVVIIDMQPKFVTRGGFHKRPSNILKVDQIISHQIEIINDAKSRNIPILVIEYVTFGETNKDLKKALKGYGNQKTFIKNRDGMFSDYNMSVKEISKALNDLNVRNLVILGANGGYCVKDSIEGSLAKEFNVVAYSKGIADFNHKDFIYPYNNKYKYKPQNCEFQEIDNCEAICNIFDNPYPLNLHLKSFMFSDEDRILERVIYDSKREVFKKRFFNNKVQELEPKRGRARGK